MQIYHNNYYLLNKLNKIIKEVIPFKNIFQPKADMDNQSSAEKEDSFLFSASLVFDENIDKLWLVLKDLSTEVKVTYFQDNLKYIKGNNTWTVGNIFTLYWVGVSNIKAKCISSMETRMKKKIKWQIVCDIGISFYEEMVLYRITKDDKTLVKIIITRFQKNKLIDYHSQIDYYTKLHNEILKSLSKHFKSIKKDKKIYQSCILDKNHLKIWNYAINFKNIENLYPEFVRNVEYNGPHNEVYTFIKCYFVEIKRLCYFRIIKYIAPIKKKTYKCIFQAIGSDLGNIPIIIELEVTIIGENKSYFSVLFNFSDQSDDNIVNIFESNLKIMFDKIKDYIRKNEKEFVIA